MRGIIVFLMMGWVSLSFADDSSILQEKLKAIRSMSASFHQVVYAKNKRISASQGSMALVRPGRFRWETKQPVEQLVLADGKHLWVYDVDLEQVTVRKQENSLGGTAALFLSNYDASLNEDFDVHAHMEGDRDYFYLHARSKQANFQKVQLIFSGQTLMGIELFDPMGQKTQVHFSHIKNNSHLAESLFQFKRPKGVDVVEQ